MFMRISQRMFSRLESFIESEPWIFLIEAQMVPWSRLKYLVKHVEYHNTETNNEHNILGTILDKKAVCESIAKSYKLLYDYNMIPAIVVFG